MSSSSGHASTTPTSPPIRVALTIPDMAPDTLDPNALAIQKAAALIEAHHYIQKFRDKVVVVKVGGSVQEDQEKLRALLADVSFMHAVGMRPVIIHGGGKSITAAMQEAGIKARWVQGRRYTDKRTLEIAERVLVEQINVGLVKHLNDAGCRAVELHSMGSCVLFGEPIELHDPETGALLDLGHVGQVCRVGTVLLNALCEDGCVPVIAPVALSAMGSRDGVWKYNVNADTAAARVAAAMGAAKLVMCSDTHGILTNPSDPESYASTLTRDEVLELIDRGVIGEGMLPKVEACLIALDAGVPKAHVIDGRVPHSILQEIYTDEGIGTQILL